MSEEVSLTNKIIAIIVKKEAKNKVDGGAPIFITENDEELEKVSMLLARITLGMVHELGNGIKVIIKH